MYRQRVDGGGEVGQIQQPPSSAATENEQSGGIEPSWLAANSITPYGDALVVMRSGGPVNSSDLWLVPLNADREPVPLLATSANEILGDISPDGRWLSYLSNKTGEYEVYVRPFPDVDRAEVQVSSGFGDDPRWSPAGGALFSRHGNRVYRVTYEEGDTFRPSTPELLFETHFHNTLGVSMDISKDGQRILVNKPLISSTYDGSLVMIDGWAEELERLVPLP